MFMTWTALRLHTPATRCPWGPAGASWQQAGHGGDGCAQIPSFAGQWWSVLALWNAEAAARDAAPARGDVDGTAWHVVLEPASYRGDASLSGGARPFDGLPPRGKIAGAAAVVTFAGLGPDAARTGEFLERADILGADVASAPGNRAALVQAPEDGAVLTFSAWETLRSAVTWAYHRPEHAGTVRRQDEHRLLATSGFLRCAVLASSGTLGDRPDPLTGLTGTRTPLEVL